MGRIFISAVSIAMLLAFHLVWTTPFNSLKPSPPYTVTVFCDLTSPFVPDGRLSLAEFSFQVVFSGLTFAFDPQEDPLMGRCQIHSEKGRGTISRLALNDVQKGDDRQSASFISARPREFSADFSIESEPTLEDEAAAKSPIPPEIVRMSFWTEFGQAKIKWGSKLGANALADFQVEFDVPFGELLQGKPHSLTLPYVGIYPEDKGTWRIEFTPEPKKK